MNFGSKNGDFGTKKYLDLVSPIKYYYEIMSPSIIPGPWSINKYDTNKTFFRIFIENTNDTHTPRIGILTIPII